MSHPVATAYAENHHDHEFHQLLADFQPDLVAIASHYDRNCPLEFDDLFQTASIALWQAQASYEDSKGPFRNYARKLIRNSVLDEVRREVRSHRAARAQEPAQDEQFYTAQGKDDSFQALTDLPGDAFDEPLKWVEVVELLDYCDSSMNDASRRVFGLLHVDDATQSVAGASLGISQQRVQQINRSTVDRVHEALA